MWDELLDPDRNWGIVPKSQNKPFIEACKTFKEYSKNKEESSMTARPKYCIFVMDNGLSELMRIEDYSLTGDRTPAPQSKVLIKGVLENIFDTGTTDKLKYTLQSWNALLANLTPKKVIFNDPATIVMWKDGTKTVVKCGENDIFDAEKGLALCFMKKAINNDKLYKKILRDGCKDYEPAEEPCLLPSIEGTSKIVRDFFSMLNSLGGQE